MLLLYNISIRAYHFAILIASIFNSKAKKWLVGRNGLLREAEHRLSGFAGQTLWVHCASLGEFEMARPIMERLRGSEPQLRIVLTFFSPSGFEIRKNYPIADHVFYLPLDTPQNAKRMVQAIRPNKVIFVKYDLWFHHLHAAKTFGAKLMLISAQFRPGQHFFKFYGSLGRRTLKLFDRIFLVDSASENLLRSIGVKNTLVCGDTRYDRVMEIAASAEPNALIASFKGNSKLVVCGSTWSEDEALLASCVGRLENTKWIIAPHEVGEENIHRLEKLLPNSVRYSKPNEAVAQILIIDSIGMLSRLYRYADVAYIGGGFKTGLHNVLEATAYGVPTVFGPDHSRFPDAGEMVEKGMAFSIRNQSELEAKFSALLNLDQDEFRASLIGFMQGRKGATEAILKYTMDC